MKIVLLCREVDRDTGKIAVHPVGKVPGDRESLLLELPLRQRLNQELQYFAVLDRRYRLNKAEIEEMLRSSELPGKEVLSNYHIIHL